MPDIFTVTVSQINRRLSMLVKDDKALSDVYVKGEISNYTYHRPSGHIYFTLKDDKASIKCVMFASYAGSLSFEPDSGMSVLVHGSVNVYEATGANQIYVTEMFPEGLGEMYLAFEKAKNELEKGGYFAQKRELPVLPKTICIITAEKGAALQDMLNIISRRCPIIKIILIPVTVQGVTAPRTLINAINRAQSTDAELIIIGRGGGSAEDLAAFNDIEFAKALFASRIPTISAVGHETDFTISDFVADKRAPTPSAAAELATSVTSDDLTAYLVQKKEAMRSRLIYLFERYEQMLDGKEQHIYALTPAKKLEYFERELEHKYRAIHRAIDNILSRAENELDGKAEYISALNPMTVLSRGYSVTEMDGTVISSVRSVKKEDSIKILLSDGSISAIIKDIQSEEKEMITNEL